MNTKKEKHHIFLNTLCLHFHEGFQILCVPIHWMMRPTAITLLSGDEKRSNKSPLLCQISMPQQWHDFPLDIHHQLCGASIWHYPHLHIYCFMWYLHNRIILISTYITLCVVAQINYPHLYIYNHLWGDSTIVLSMQKTSTTLCVVAQLYSII